MSVDEYQLMESIPLHKPVFASQLPLRHQLSLFSSGLLSVLDDNHLSFIVLKSRTAFEYPSVVAPSLESFDFPRCIRLVIDHHIGIVVKLNQFIDSV